MSDDEGSNKQNSGLNQFAPVQSLQKLIYEFETAKKKIDSQNKEIGDLKNKTKVLQREKQQMFESTYHLNLIAHQLQIIHEKGMNLFDQMKFEIDPTQRKQFEESIKQISQVSLEEIENRVSGQMDELFPFEKDFQIIVPSSARQPSLSLPSIEELSSQENENNENYEPPQKKRKLDHNVNNSPSSSFTTGNSVVGNVPQTVPVTNRKRPSPSVSTIVPPPPVPPIRTQNPERSVPTTSQAKPPPNRSNIIPPPQLIFGGGIYLPPKIGIHEWIERERFRGLPPRSPVPKRFYPNLSPRLTQMIFLDNVTKIYPLNDHIMILARLGSLHLFRKNLTQMNHLKVKEFKIYEEKDNQYSPHIIRAIERHHSSPQDLFSEIDQSQRLLVCGCHPDSYSVDLNKCVIARTFSSPSSFLPYIFPSPPNQDTLVSVVSSKSNSNGSNNSGINNSDLQFFFQRQEQYKLLQSKQPKSVCNYTICSSEDGREVYVGGNQGIIQKFDSRTPNCVEFFQGHTQGTAISRLKVLSSSLQTGKYLVSSGTDRTVRLWDLRYNGNKRAQFEYNEYCSSSYFEYCRNNSLFPYLESNYESWNRNFNFNNNNNINNNNNGRNPYVAEVEEEVSEQEQRILKRIKQTQKSKKRVINDLETRRRKQKKKKKKQSSNISGVHKMNRNIDEDEDEDDDEEEEEEEEDEDEDELDDDDEPRIVRSYENEKYLNHKDFFQPRSQIKGKRRKQKKKKKKGKKSNKISSFSQLENRKKITSSSSLSSSTTTKSSSTVQISATRRGSRRRVVERFGELKCFMTKFSNTGFSSHPCFPHMINVIGSEGQEFIDLKTCEHSSFNYYYPHYKISSYDQDDDDEEEEEEFTSEEEEEEEEEEGRRRRQRKRKRRRRKSTKHQKSSQMSSFYQPKKFYTSIDIEPVFGSWFACGGKEGNIEFINFPRGPVIRKHPCYTIHNVSEPQEQQSPSIVDIKLIPSSTNLIRSNNNQCNGYSLDMFVVTSQNVQKYAIQNNARVNLKI